MRLQPFCLGALIAGDASRRNHPILSVAADKFEHMSEWISGPHAAAAAVDAITLATREENAAGARRLAAIGDLWALRAPDDDVEKRYWAIDGYSGVMGSGAAQVTVQGVFCADQRETYDDVVQMYGVSRDYFVHYEEL